jgi:Ca2+-binding RTX toxin-like protein
MTGNDTYVITNASTMIVENSGEGTDLVQFGSTTASTTYTLANNVENLTLTGLTAINGTGNSGDNLISGNSAGNTLNGSTGNDTLDGGDGLDTLTGGTGSDIFLFHSATAFHNIDVVSDFSTGQTDKINIADLLTGFHSGTDNIADFVSFVTSGTTDLLKVDMDGTGSTYSMTQIATLSGITGLSAATLLANGELIVS